MAFERPLNRVVTGAVPRWKQGSAGYDFPNQTAQKSGQRLAKGSAYPATKVNTILEGKDTAMNYSIYLALVGAPGGHQTTEDSTGS